MKIIAVMNQKGGIGKTMTAAAIAYILGEEKGKRVLIADADQQGNISMLYGRYDEEGQGMAELLENHRTTGGAYATADLIQTTVYNNIDIIPANGYLMRTNMNLMLTEQQNQVTRFTTAMEEVKEAYVNQAKIVGNEKVLEKVFAVGSPKIDKICEICKDGIPVPDIWKEMSVNKKKVFMNTNVSLILNNKDKFIDNLRRIFDIFKRRGDVFVIWREHPLTEATLKSMKPEIRDVYYEIRSDFVKDGLGVIDTNSEAYEAIYFSDCYFGSGGSLAPIYAVTGKPILITAYKYPDNISSQQATIEMLLKQTERSMFFSERYENFLDLFLDNIDLLTSYKEKRFEFLSKIVDSIDGTTGNKIMLQVKDMLNKERRG